MSGALVSARLAGGTWEGVLRGGGEAPRVAASHEGRDVPGVTVAAEGGAWVVRVPVPPEAVADGVHTVVVRDAATGEAIASFALVAGEALAGDLRAEIGLLRAELDLLKRAFRRHCVETGGPGG